MLHGSLVDERGRGHAASFAGSDHYLTYLGVGRFQCYRDNRSVRTDFYFAMYGGISYGAHREHPFPRSRIGHERPFGVGEGSDVAFAARKGHRGKLNGGSGIGIGDDHAQWRRRYSGSSQREHSRRNIFVNNLFHHIQVHKTGTARGIFPVAFAGFIILTIPCTVYCAICNRSG